MFTQIIVNNIQVSGNTAMTILQVCNLLGIYVPRFCYHEKLSIVGSCRMCLVELHKAFKPIVSCATPLLTGMNIHTETALIKNSREHILEFLLVNHPLDCPICDQGGECDLQDQALIYGSDRGRFKEKKRAVSNKNFGPLIKTVMTRCIHCTRCVRFMSEIALDNVLGTLGRGKDMEIGTYINKSINSEISGNIIDICPVGALTSKPFAFANRSWELRSTESIDIFDGLGSSIRLDSRGSEIVRILPKTNESINEQWITNKIRFTYDGLKYQRLAMPLVRRNKWQDVCSKYIFVNVSWECVIRLVSIILIYCILICGIDNVLFAIGQLTDLDSIYVVNKMIGLLGMVNSCNEAAKLNTSNIDFRENYMLNRPIAHFDHAGAYVFLGANLQVDAPLLNIRLFRKIRHKKLIGFFGTFLKGAHIGIQLGIHTVNLIRMLEGRHFFCRLINNSHNVCWITTDKHSYNGWNIFNALNMFAFTNNSVNYFSTLHGNCTQVGIRDIGLTIPFKELNRYIYPRVVPSLYYSIGAEYSDTDRYNYIIYQSSHRTYNSTEVVHIFLPSTTFTEKTKFYVNTEGRLLSTRKAVASPGLAKDDTDILAMLHVMLGFDSFGQDGLVKTLQFLAPYLFLSFKWRVYNLYSIAWHISYLQYIMSICINNVYTVHNTVHTYFIDNYYSTNFITAVSKILNKCIIPISNYMNYY